MTGLYCVTCKKVLLSTLQLHLIRQVLRFVACAVLYRCV